VERKAITSCCDVRRARERAPRSPAAATAAWRSPCAAPLRLGIASAASTSISSQRANFAPPTRRGHLRARVATSRLGSTRKPREAERVRPPQPVCPKPPLPRSEGSSCRTFEPLHARDRPHDHLRDRSPGFRVALGPEIDDDQQNLAAIVGVDRPGVFSSVSRAAARARSAAESAPRNPRARDRIRSGPSAARAARA